LISSFYTLVSLEPIFSPTSSTDSTANRYDYVLSDDFAKGLVLPIEIKPDGKKGDAKTHGEMVE